MKINCFTKVGKIKLERRYKIMESKELLKGILANPRYKTAEVIGDKYLIEKVNLYLEGREKVLNQKNINVSRIEFYEQKLIKDDWDAWWYHYTKNYLNAVLWLLKRLKNNITPEQEFNLLKQFYNKLPGYVRKNGLYGMDDISNDKELTDYFTNNNIKVV
jgi:hypothetical protein